MVLPGGFGLDYIPTFSYSNGGGNDGWEQVSLGDLLGNPTMAIPQVQRNLMSNWQAILVGSFFTSMSFRIARKVLRRPLSKINTGLFGKRGIIGNIGFKL